MSEENYKSYIGDKVKVEGESTLGVVSRIDFDRGLVYVLFTRLREEVYPFPEAITSGKITKSNKATK